MYVGIRKRGMGRRLAGAHSLSGLRGLRGRGPHGLGAWVNGRYYSKTRLQGIVAQRLGQIDYGSNGSFYDESTGYYNPPQTASIPTAAGSSGGLTPSETALI